MPRSILFTAALLLGTAAVAQGNTPGDAGAPGGQPPAGATMPMPADAAPPGGTTDATATPQGGMPQGAAPQGAMPQGAMPQGAMPMPAGSMPQGGAPTGEAKTYPKCSRTVRDNCMNASAGRRGR